MQALLWLHGAEHWIDREAIDDNFHIHSWIKVCPVCHTVWAKLCVLEEIRFDILDAVCGGGAACRAKSPDDLWPGSFISLQHKFDYTDWDLLDSLPTDLLVREFNITMEALK
jgi:hypothetical protein